MSTILSLHDVCKSFEGKSVLKKVSFEVRRGEFVSILGKSGSGKTTLLRLIAGFEKPDGGDIILEGKKIASSHHFLPAEQRGIAVVFQDHALWPHMNVFDNVAFPLKVQKIPHDIMKREVSEALHLMDMGEFARRMPHELSGGESQRIALARALVQKPRMIVFDEPLASLDALLRFELQGSLKKLQSTQGFTSLYITHDQHEAMRLSNRIAVLENGEITQFSSPFDLYHHPDTENIAKIMGQSMCFTVNILEIRKNKAKIEVEGCILTVDSPKNPSNILCLKSENIEISDNIIENTDKNSVKNILPVTVMECSFMGDFYLIGLQSQGKNPLIFYKKHTDGMEVGRLVYLHINSGWLLPSS